MPSSILDFCLRVLKILLDIYVLFVFLELHTYFVMRKKTYLEVYSLGRFSCFNKLIIVWTIILSLANFFHSLANIMYNALIANYTTLSDDPGYDLFSKAFSGLYVPVVDFLTAMTLLYLFYFQGMQTLKNLRAKSRVMAPPKTIEEGSSDQLSERDDMSTIGLKEFLNKSHSAEDKGSSSHGRAPLAFAENMEGAYLNEGAPGSVKNLKDFVDSKQKKKITLDGGELRHMADSFTDPLTPGNSGTNSLNSGDRGRSMTGAAGLLKSMPSSSKTSKTSHSTNSYVRRFLVDQMQMAPRHGYDF